MFFEIIYYLYISNNIVKEGIVKNIIIFGQSASLSKINSRLGKEYSLGYYLAFSEYDRLKNNKYKIKLLIYDDQYNEKITKDNVELLDKYNGIFGLIGTVGTPTTFAISDYIKDKKIPLLQPLTGSSLLRKEINRNVIHTRPSYYDEIDVIFKFMIHKKLKNLSIIYQNDLYGLSIMNDINTLLSKNDFINNKINIVSSAFCNADDIILNRSLGKLLNITNIHNLNEVKNSDNLQKIEALLILSGSKNTIDCIRYIKIYKPSIYIFGISFAEIIHITDSIKLIDKKYLNCIYSTQVIKLDTDNDKRLLEQINKSKEILKKKINSDNTVKNEFKDYNDVLREKYKSPNLIEGYINGLYIINILKKIKGSVTRENFINKIYNIGKVDIFGYKFNPYFDILDCNNINKDCPCNKGLREIYLYKYDIDDYKFRLEKFNTGPVDCNNFQ